MIETLYSKDRFYLFNAQIRNTKCGSQNKCSRSFHMLELHYIRLYKLNQRHNIKR